MRIFNMTILGVALVLGSNLATAEDGCCEANGCCRAFQSAAARCCPTVTREPVKKKCYDVECKQICIPAVKFPWERRCEMKRGKVITVRTLKKREYECGERSVYHWKIEQCGPCKGPA